MRKFLMLLLTIIAVTSLVAAAPTLPVDSRKVPMQTYRDYSHTEIAPTDTLWTKISLPKGCVAVQFLSLVDSVQVAQDSTYTATPGLLITKEFPQLLPVIRRTELWIRRAAAGTASKVRVIFYR